MIGSQGTGKSMLAARLPTILATGGLGAKPLMTRRPFRTPHYTISDAGMAGGGNPPAPGEISLADLEGSEAVRSEHVVEASGYRSLDRKLWMR
jgi:predicted ATPase with chaperone activity